MLFSALFVCKCVLPLGDNPIAVNKYIKPRRIRGAGHVARMGERKGIYRGLVQKTDRKRTPGRPRCRLGDNIKMDLQEVGCGQELD